MLSTRQMDNANAPASDRPIFLVGSPRSGTTLLSLMLHAHPRIAMPPETRFVPSAYRNRRLFGDLKLADDRQRLAEWLTEPAASKFADLRLDRDSVIAEIVAGPPTLGSAVGIVLRAFARFHGKVRWGEKHAAAYSPDIDVILRLFPDAQIVHLIRDGRACVASLKRLAWFKGGLPGAIATWRLSQEWLKRDSRSMAADSYYEVRFEQLVNFPRETLERLCQYLGEDFDERMLEHQKVAATIVRERETWHALTHGRVQEDRTNAWRTELQPSEIGLIERVAGRALEECGYRLTYKRVRLPLHEVVSCYGEYWRRNRRIKKRRSKDRHLQDSEATPIAALLTRRQIRAASL